MKHFVYELKQRNKTLYYFGWINIACAALCLIAMLFDHTQIIGINAWIKPMKFFVSVAIFTWTMGWLLHYLNEPKKVRAFNTMLLIVFIFELGYIALQAFRGQKSHFNFSSPTTIFLYSVMGIAITLSVVWTGYFAIIFCRRSFPDLSPSYLWGIRLGMIMFVLFALSAHVMASSTGHTVGAPDGSAGLPVVNWSTKYGDLRAAHFFGMHALQLLPLIGFYSKNLKVTLVVSLLYFAFTSAIFFMAIMGKPLINFS